MIRTYPFGVTFVKEPLEKLRLNPQSLAPGENTYSNIKGIFFVGLNQFTLSRIYKNAIEFV